MESLTFEQAKIDLFNETELTLDEIDEVLRKAGYDPDAIGRQIAAAAKQALKRVKRLILDE